MYGTVHATVYHTVKNKNLCLAMHDLTTGALGMCTWGTWGQTIPFQHDPLFCTKDHCVKMS